MPDPRATLQSTTDCVVAMQRGVMQHDVMQRDVMNDVLECSQAWLLVPKGQEHIRVSQPFAPEGRCKR
jgi:hypothetical protein